VEVGGRTSQDLGLGRIVGQMLVYLYLKEGACSLDQIGQDLGLSKAAVSVAVRQLESLGLLRRSWQKGDRKNYYRTADNIASALQEGLFRFVSQKISVVGSELDQVAATIEPAAGDGSFDADLRFLHQRVKRAKLLKDRAQSLLNNPLLKMLVKT